MHNRTKEATSCAMENGKKEDTDFYISQQTQKQRHYNRRTDRHKLRGSKINRNPDTRETWTRNFTSTDLNREQEFFFGSQTPYDPHKDSIHRLSKCLTKCTPTEISEQAFLSQH